MGIGPCYVVHALGGYIEILCPVCTKVVKWKSTVQSYIMWQLLVQVGSHFRKRKCGMLVIHKICNHPQHVLQCCWFGVLHLSVCNFGQQSFLQVFPHIFLGHPSIWDFINDLQRQQYKQSLHYTRYKMQLKHKLASNITANSHLLVRHRLL